MEFMPAPPPRPVFPWENYADGEGRVFDWDGMQQLFAPYFETLDQLLISQRNWGQRNDKHVRRQKLAPGRYWFAIVDRTTPKTEPTVGRPFLNHMRTGVEVSRRIDVILSEAGKEVRSLADEAYRDDEPRREAAYAVAQLLDPEVPE